jgi:hypothetical protein
MIHLNSQAVTLVRYLRAEPGQQTANGRHVHKFGNPTNTKLSRTQQGRGENGKSSILCTADCDFYLKPVSTFDDDLIYALFRRYVVP